MTFEDLPLKRQSTAQQVASGLSDMIMSGALTAGAPLRESAIAASLGISRNTVREAVRILEQGGLVRHEMHRGAVVIEPSVDELDELYQARLRLEVAAVRHAHAPERVRAVRAAFEELAEATASGQAHEIVVKDLAFHAAVVGLLASKRIDAFYSQLATELRFYLMVLSVTDREYERPESVLEEHRPILDALESGDTEAAVQAVTVHVEGNGERLKAILEGRSQSPS
ncbi:GntR family transcriptional regulator [Planosporangium flavigriseum]|uniref:GntR family transcriptional regulator n=1 Tax=Planosporangium flavigriseum TaxID=373681 RepID=A0A8J3LSG6_9ACTN|nr:GntR family transcriptional regulator [Planosporangium flavigriseum]GIG75995.1 GntR family transcriptional regulator [Planosporangium flavigriseum]